ncbi:MAG: hypothetical protein GAK31_00967 [Stenotrophomonas maltophilia]|uniref:Transmembrane protein n=1 Tax=Stenotrophomonas maltophilia TaxID=40324 RepID=A0A7V8JLQ0_STEMA|nr:MAG: hypothetical protein GAK31_00967 [Stenotrophomonas maltophilia]
MSTPERPVPAWLRLLQACGALWTLPNTALGLLAGLAGLLAGARLRWSARDCALVFDHWPWGPGGAITFGNVILHTGHDLGMQCRTYAHQAGHRVEPLIRLDDHERAHVFQYLVLGPLYLPVYLLCGGVSARNRFEWAADRYAQTGRGWWPWSTPGAPVR